MIAVASKRPFDIVGVVDSVPLAIEVKRSSGIPLQPHQLAQLQLVTRAGGLAFKLERNRFFMINPDGTMEYTTDQIPQLMNFIRLK
jgi:Holliday junction resolvase